MLKYFLALVLLASTPVFAQEAPASDASIRELLTISNAKSLVENVYAQTDGYMAKVMKEAMGDVKLNAEQEKLMAEMRGKMIDTMRELMSWEKLEPQYIKLYKDTFSQKELDGLLAFYKTDAGKAMLAKLPTLTQNLMKYMMEQMQVMMPRVREIANEYAEKVKAAK